MYLREGEKVSKQEGGVEREELGEGAECGAQRRALPQDPEITSRAKTKSRMLYR